MKVLFFGCWGRIGHFLWLPNGQWPESDAFLPWKRIDGVLAPQYGGEQVEGSAEIHHKGGWTALAWWDRSVDTRDGSTAVLFAEGTYFVDEMLTLGRAHFPSVFSRFDYEIKVL